jgi:hypothetical protein
VGDCLRATVIRFANKANDDGPGTHLIGAFVQLENGMSALLHKSQMFDIKDVDEGAAIFVSIRSAAMDGNRPKVSVKQISPSTFGHASSKKMWGGCGSAPRRRPRGLLTASIGGTMFYSFVPPCAATNASNQGNFNSFIIQNWRKHDHIRTSKGARHQGVLQNALSKP